MNKLEKIVAFVQSEGLKAWLSEHGDVNIEIPLSAGYPPVVEHAATMREARIILGY